MAYGAETSKLIRYPFSSLKQSDLHHAMNEGKNIFCETGVTGQLLFQLRNYYIPIISHGLI